MCSSDLDNLPPPTPPKISNVKTTGPKVKRARTEYTKERGSPWEEENRHVDGPSFLDEEETPTVKRRGRGRPRYVVLHRNWEFGGNFRFIKIQAFGSDFMGNVESISITICMACIYLVDNFKIISS